MLDKHFRKRLLEHSWEEIENQETNKYQMWIRKRDLAITSLNDLTLMAKKLPPDKKREIFHKDIMSKFFNSVLPDKLYEDFYDMELVSYLTSRCLKITINRYKKINKHSPHLTSYTVEQIQRTKEICSDITNIAISLDLKRKATENKQVYLFRSDRFSIIDFEDFFDYIFRLLGKMKNGGYVSEDREFPWQFSKENSALNIQIDIIDLTVPEDDMDQVMGNITLSMDPTNSKAYLTIKIEDEIKTKTLIMKYDNNRKIYTYYEKA